MTTKDERGAQLIITNPKEGDVIVKCEDGNYRVEPQGVPAAGPWIRVDSGPTWAIPVVILSLLGINALLADLTERRKR